MSEKRVIITQAGGGYQIQRGEIADYELIGLLECVLFDLKQSRITKTGNDELRDKGIDPAASPARTEDKSGTMDETKSEPIVLQGKSESSAETEAAGAGVPARLPSTARRTTAPTTNPAADLTVNFDAQKTTPSAPAAASATAPSTVPPTAGEPPAAADLRTRIGNAIRAINGLGGQIEQTDLRTLTDEELEAELAELTAQYKRLKQTRQGK